MLDRKGLIWNSQSSKAQGFATALRHKDSAKRLNRYLGQTNLAHPQRKKHSERAKNVALLRSPRRNFLGRNQFIHTHGLLVRWGAHEIDQKHEICGGRPRT